MNGDTITGEIDRALLSPLLRGVQIPPRPELLTAVQTELQTDDPDPQRLALLVNDDVAMSAALLKLANSPLMGLSRRAETVNQAFTLLGMLTVESLLVEIALRRALPSEGPALTRFWDVATRRAHAMAFLARRERIAPSDVAHTCGLFLDVGIALLLRWPLTPPYLNTLAIANDSLEPFTQIERERHGLDHALVGAAMAHGWGVGQGVVLAVRQHHDYAMLDDTKPPQVLRQLVALTCVVEYIIQRYEGLNQTREWDKGGEAALRTLGLSEAELAVWSADVHLMFNQGG
ncbi:HDOD domain-containing protein [Inhella sp.]|uniref:HDOD domain-containing protein n=1 Tax=Inhella sp. TaxID=1921806 RepID=UPI0035B08C54